MEITLWNPPPFCQFPSQPRIASWGCLPTSLYPLAELWHQPKATKSRPLVGLGLVLSLWDLCSSEDHILWVSCNPLGLSAQNQPTPGRDLPHQENPICPWLLGPSGWLDCWLLIFLSNIVEKKGMLYWAFTKAVILFWSSQVLFSWFMVFMLKLWLCNGLWGILYALS